MFDSWWHHLLKSKTILIPDFFQNSGIFLFLEQVKPIGMRININRVSPKTLWVCYVNTRK